MLKNLFTRKPIKKVVAEDVKNMIRAKITKARIMQRRHPIGSDYWNRYQSQCNALTDLKDTINVNFNLK